MNILITAPSLNPAQNVSGVSTVVQTIIQYNIEHTYYHYLLGRPDKNLNRFMWLFQLVKQLVLFPFILKKNKIDLVHQNLPLDPKGVLREFIINLWCRLLSISVVLHVHGGLFITQGTSNKLFIKLSQSLFNNSQQVIVLSELERKLLKEKFNYAYAKVLSNSIDTSTFKINSVRQLSKNPILLYLGRIEKNKGIVELVEALKLLKNDSIFRFILCGAGPLTEYCKIECDKFLGENFEFKGVVYGEEKINIIKESNIFLLPSYFEGLPMALLETMAAGVVPIVTNVGSMKYIVENGINGLLVEKYNPQDLYEKMKSIISNHELYNLLSINARKNILENFDISNYIIRLNDIYNQAIDFKSN